MTLCILILDMSRFLFQSICILSGVAGGPSCTGIPCPAGSYGSPGTRGIEPCDRGMFEAEAHVDMHRHEARDGLATRREADG